MFGQLAGIGQMMKGAVGGALGQGAPQSAAATPPGDPAAMQQTQGMMGKAGMAQPTAGAGGALMQALMARMGQGGALPAQGASGALMSKLDPANMAMNASMPTMAGGPAEGTMPAQPYPPTLATLVQLLGRKPQQQQGPAAGAVSSQPPMQPQAPQMG